MSGTRARAGSTRRELRLERFLPYVLANLAERVSARLFDIYGAEFGLSVAEWRVLANLAQHGTLNAKQVVDLTVMEKSTVSRAVKSLAARALLRRKTASNDGRAKNLTLTPAGKALYRKIVPEVLAWETRLLEGLNAAEYRDLLYLLEKLGRRLHMLA